RRAREIIDLLADDILVVGDAGQVALVVQLAAPRTLLRERRHLDNVRRVLHVCAEFGGQLLVIRSKLVFPMPGGRELSIVVLGVGLHGVPDRLKADRAFSAWTCLPDGRPAIETSGRNSSYAADIDARDAQTHDH